MELEQVADFVQAALEHADENPIFCGIGTPASDYMIVTQLANHFTINELQSMRIALHITDTFSWGIDPNVEIIVKLLGLTSITEELIEQAIRERQGEVYVDWSGDSYKGEGW